MALLESFAAFGLTELRQWIVDRKLPLMFERSLRIQPETVEVRRALFSIPTASLGSEAAHEVLQICRAMRSPDHHKNAIRRFFHAADFVAFWF